MVRPLYAGTARFKGEEFGSAPFFFYTAPFIPYGEINLDAIRLVDGNKITGNVPYFTYAVTYNNQMEAAKQQEYAIAYTLAQQKVNPRKRLNYMTDQLENRFRAGRHELLVATMVLHLASGSHLPISHLINAGDVMGGIDEWGNLRHLTWITIRGGLKVLPNIEDVSAYLQTHQETLPPFAEGEKYLLYGDVSDDEFRQAFEEAVGCFDYSALNRFRR